MTDKEIAKSQVADLIARYDSLSPARRRALSEMDTRRIFILFAKRRRTALKGLRSCSKTTS